MSGRGVERLLDLLEWLADSPGPHGLAAVAASLDMPKSSALQMLRTLTERNYLERLPDGDYALRRLPGDIGTGGQGRGALLALVGPYVARAVETTCESGFLAVPEGRQIRYLGKVLPQREIRYDRDISMTRPAHKVASGIVILAAGSDEGIAAYAEAEGLTPAEAETLRASVDSARRDGFFLNLRGVVEGAAGAAAPILDASGCAVGAINISGPQTRLAQHAELVSDVVRRTAEEVSAELARRGGRFSKGGEDLR